MAETNQKCQKPVKTDRKTGKIRRFTNYLPRSLIFVRSAHRIALCCLASDRGVPGVPAAVWSRAHYGAQPETKRHSRCFRYLHYAAPPPAAAPLLIRVNIAADHRKYFPPPARLASPAAAAACPLVRGAVTSGAEHRRSPRPPAPPIQPRENCENGILLH